MQTARRTKIMVTILSPYDQSAEGVSLSQIAEEMDNGEWLGNLEVLESVILPKNMVRRECRRLGNDGTFFDDVD